jgi:hypothetical protein
MTIEAKSKYVWNCNPVQAEDWNGKIEEPFFVPAPKPYCVEGKNLEDHQKEGLLKKAQKLWKILELLRIDIVEAWVKDYTLHPEAFRKLREMAQQLAIEWQSGRGSLPDYQCEEAIKLIDELRASA